MAQVEEYVQRRTAEYHVWLRDPAQDVLPPVVLTIMTGAIHFQDYMTPTQARDLADNLLANARLAEVRTEDA